MEEKVMTLHPDGKSGVNISRAKYDQIRETIVSVLGERGEMTFTDLGAEMSNRLEGRFEGSISWYYTTVKLDLEARGVIERIDGRSSQRIRLRQG